MLIVWCGVWWGREYAKRGVRQLQQIRELSAKLQTVERSLSQVVMDSELALSQKTSEFQTKQDNWKRESAALKASAAATQKQLEVVKKHAQTLLAQVCAAPRCAVLLCCAAVLC